MTTLGDQIAPFIQRMARSDVLSDEERVTLGHLFVESRSFPARTTIVRPHVPQDRCQLLLDGVVARQIELPDGRRQILALHVAGDFVDLHSLVLKSLDHALVALSPVRLAFASHGTLREIAAERPHLARLFWFATCVDAAISREWIASLSRPAAGRIAHLLCELRMRLEAVGRTDPHGYALPITQIDLADATALTAVHVNRTLRQLREANLVDFRSGRVEIGNLAGLERLAGFKPDYLYLQSSPR